MVAKTTSKSDTGKADAQRLVFVTGPSGAGRSTAVKTLEDIGFEAIDNLPLSLLPRLLDGPPIGRPLALGVDVRNRDFSVNAFIEVIDNLVADPEMDIELLYLDCNADVLIRRFSETRRPHPLAAAETPSQGIDAEFDLLVPVRARANVLIDTTDLTPHDLRREIEQSFKTQLGTRLAVSMLSFSYKRGMPRGADMVFDCRFLRNPHWEPELRTLDGRDKAVANYVEADVRYEEFFNNVRDLVTMLLPAFTEEGKSHLTIAFGCTGGQHRSVAVAEKLANALAASGWQVSTRHREIERRGIAGTASYK
jgi:UPF0042 nucleotide-binding protein